jgi:hypothetical protein
MADRQGDRDPRLKSWRQNIALGAGCAVICVAAAVLFITAVDGTMKRTQAFYLIISPLLFIVAGGLAFLFIYGGLKQRRSQK